MMELYLRHKILTIPIKPLPRSFHLPDNYKELSSKANDVVIKHSGKNFARITKSICIDYWSYYGGEKDSHKKITDNIEKILHHLESLNKLTSKTDSYLSYIFNKISEEKKFEEYICTDGANNYYDKLRSIFTYAQRHFETTKTCIQDSEKYPTLSGRERLVLNLATLYTIAMNTTHPFKGACQFAVENMTPGWEKISDDENDGMISGRFLDFVNDFFEVLEIKTSGKEENKNNTLGKFIYEALRKAKQILGQS